MEVRGSQKGIETHATAVATALSDTTSPFMTPQVVQRQQKAKTLRRREVDTFGSCRMTSLECAPSRLVITSMLQPALSRTDLHQNILAKKCGQSSSARESTEPFASSPREVEKPASGFQPFSGLGFYEQQSKHDSLWRNKALGFIEVDLISRLSAGGTTTEAAKTPERPFLMRVSTRNGGSMHSSRYRIGSKGHELVQHGVCGRLHPATIPLVCTIPLQILPQHQQKEAQMQQGACCPLVTPVLQRMSLLDSQKGHQSLCCSLKKCSALKGRFAHLHSYSHSHTSCLAKIKSDRGLPSGLPVQQNDKQLSRKEKAPSDGKHKVTGKATNMSITCPCTRRGTNLPPCARGALDSRLEVSDHKAQTAQSAETEASTAASGVASSVQVRPSTPAFVQKLDATASKQPLVNATLPVPTHLRSVDSKSAKLMPTSTATKTGFIPSAEVPRTCCGSGVGPTSCPVNTASNPGMFYSPSRATSPLEQKTELWQTQLESAARKPARPRDSAGNLNVEGRFDGDTQAVVPQSPVNRRLLAAPAVPSPRTDVATQKSSEGGRWLEADARDRQLMRKRLASGYAVLSFESRPLDFARKPCQECYRDEEDDLRKPQELERLRHTTISFVCVGSLMSLLERCCCISHFGPDEQLQQKNDLATSPFHCSSRPQISLEEYFVKRIFRHGRLCINEGILALALLSRFLCSQNAALADALQSSRQLEQQQVGVPRITERTNTSTDSGPEGHALTPPLTLHCKADLAATAAQIGFVEFNYLTAHRLLLTAALLAKKTHRDEHTNIRHWAQEHMPVPSHQALAAGDEGYVNDQIARGTPETRLRRDFEAT
ncbi:hypothetical protein Esti_000681 [Eimeria stiedai]